MLQTPDLSEAINPLGQDKQQRISFEFLLYFAVDPAIQKEVP